MGATYAKLQSGEWGVRTTGLKVSPGLVLTVEKRDGTRKQETVARVVWSQGDAAICAIVPSAKPSPSGAPRSRPVSPVSPRRGRPWRPCGYPGCNPSYCDECDGEGG